LLIDTAAIVDAYRKAKVLPTIINHIRYSMLLAFGLLWLVYFMVNNIVINHKVERKIQVLIFLYLFITLHVLAVRSGLILFYAGTLLYLTLVGFKHKKYKLLLGFYVVLMLMLMLMINAIPQLKNKIKYTKYDWDMHTQDIDLSQFSDGKRIAAYVASIDVISEKPWIGVGPTKVKPALDAYFSVHYPTLKSSFIDPHNQFLNAGVAAGLLGIVGLFVTVYVPFICSKMHHSSLSAAFLVMITLSFLVESTLETQL
jgi:O-antigen ligase